MTEYESVRRGSNPLGGANFYCIISIMLDWVAAVFEISGGWLIGNKKTIGFYLNICGLITWIIVAITSQIYGLLLVAIFAMIVNIRNILKWRKENGKV